MSKMMTINEAVEKWEISNSMLARLCRDGRIPGAEKVKKFFAFHTEQFIVHNGIYHWRIMLCKIVKFHIYSCSVNIFRITSAVYIQIHQTVCKTATAPVGNFFYKKCKFIGIACNHKPTPPQFSLMLDMLILYIIYD